MDKKQEWGVSLITAGVGGGSVFTFVFFLARYPAQMLAGVNDAFLGATRIFSVPLMLFTFVTTFILPLENMAASAWVKESRNIPISVISQ